MKAFRLRVAIALLAAFTFAACLPGAAIADEGDLQSSLDDYAAGRYDDALTKLKDYLAGNPDSSEVYAVLRSAEDRSLIRAMAQGGDHQRYVQYLLDLARPAADADGLSEDDIKAAAEAAVEDPAIDVRRRAAVRLRQAGALAVPYLYPYFAEENVDRVVNAMLALKQIGMRATLPLCEVLQSDNARVRGFAAATLGEIGDRRAAPCLKAAAAGDSDAGVQERATKALGKIGARGGSASDSYVRVGNRYYRRDLSLAEDFSAMQNMWRWEDGSLQRYEVPYYLFAYQMAEEYAADALALDNSHGGARCLLVRSILAQALEAEARGDDAPEALAGATSVAASQGFAAASDALRASLRARDWDVATRCADLMAATYGGESLASSPLGDALAAPHKHLRYSAAIAALQMSPKKSLPNANKVAALAAQAASESAVRQVLVIDDVDETRSKLMMALAHSGYVSSSEARGTEGVMRAKAAPSIDVIVIRADLGDQANTIPNDRHTTSLAAIDELTRDARTRDMSIVVLLSDTDEQKQDAIKEFLAAKYGDKIKAFISTPIVETATLSEIATAAEAKDLNDDRKRANALAARAADAFASMDFTCRSFDLSVAIEPLSTAATQGPTPEIRINAVRALGNLRVGGADALMTALTEGDSDELKAAAATALGSVLAVHEGTPEQVDALIAATEGDGPVAAAALNAVGQVKSLSDAQRDQLFRMHRRKVASRAQ